MREGAGRTGTDSERLAGVPPRVGVARTVLVADAKPDKVGDGVSHVLDDLAKALAVYDRLAREALRETDAEPLAVMRYPSTDVPDKRPADGKREARGHRPVDGKRETRDCLPADALVIGVSGAIGISKATDVRTTITSLTDAMPVCADALVYAIIASGDGRADQARTHVETYGLDPDGSSSAAVLAEACSQAGLRWAGGLLVPDGLLLHDLLLHPRMGAVRRALSEATDDLVCAVRSGMSVADAARAFSWEPGRLLPSDHNLLVIRATRQSRLTAWLAHRLGTVAKTR